MKIRSLYVDGYKNLIRTQINFSSTEIPIAIIGNNGTGKSNLIESLIAIFIGLYFDSEPGFKYNIVYECRGKVIQIDHRAFSNNFEILVDNDRIARSRFKKWIRETVRPFPDLIFCYYSGTCERTVKLIEKYNKSYNRQLRDQDRDIDRLFAVSDINQAKWSLVGLFAHRHTELLSRFSVLDIERFKITLAPPVNYSEQTDDPSYWGTTGAVREFLADLDNAASETYRPSGNRGFLRDRNFKTHVFDKTRLERIGSALERRGTNFQSMMLGLASRKMVEDIEFEVINSRSGASYGIDDFSEGEKQLLCVIGGLKLYSQRESLVLLDEPDTHLNPAWSWEYDSLLKYALTEEQKSGSTILLATHDPVIISGMRKQQVLIAYHQNGQLNYVQPIRDPRGQGVANVLTSEFFGLPSSLDKNTQNLLDERLVLAYKETLTEVDRLRLTRINLELDHLGMSIAFRDPEYAAFERQKYANSQEG